MITNEMVEAGCAAANKRYLVIEDENAFDEAVKAGITAAFAAMPWPAVKVKALEWEWVVGDVEVAGPYKLDRMRPWRSGKPKKY